MERIRCALRYLSFSFSAASRFDSACACAHHETEGSQASDTASVPQPDSSVRPPQPHWVWGLGLRVKPKGHVG